MPDTPRSSADPALVHRTPVVTLHASTDAPIGAALSFASAAVLTGEGLRSILAERVEQIDRHGHTPGRDLQYEPGDLIAAACCYADTAHDQVGPAPLAYDPAEVPGEWPWQAQFWRPRDPRTNLVKAVALLWAAIDYLDGAPRDAGEAANDPAAEQAA